MSDTMEAQGTWQIHWRHKERGRYTGGKRKLADTLEALAKCQIHWKRRGTEMPGRSGSHAL